MENGLARSLAGRMRERGRDNSAGKSKWNTRLRDRRVRTFARETDGDAGSCDGTLARSAWIRLS